MAEQENMEDLPLMANVSEVLVRHYSLEFACDLDAKCFTCNAILLLEPVATETDDKCICSEVSSKAIGEQEKESGHESSPRGFAVVLDCHEIDVKQVVALDHNNLEGQPLSFRVVPWALQMWSSHHNCRFCFPRNIRISYSTLPHSPSLMWVQDQAGRPCVFTYGSPVNNRSLLPCQEPPVAMATWEAVVTVTGTATVLMSGDEEPTVTAREGRTAYQFRCLKPLPMSTLCLAVGFWEEYEMHSPLKFDCKCRLFACPTLFDESIQKLSDYIPRCLVEAESILGPYPFPRIDFLIAPPTFGSLGMASPNVVFLSQSVLFGPGLLSRVAHEVTHGWFGLSLGPLDWGEEWMSEGFATFLEDALHAKVAQMSDSDAVDYFELRAFLRKQMLSYEIENTKEELQILKPPPASRDVGGLVAPVVRNGQNPHKTFMQVHYIKGYFLLKYLSNTVGQVLFLQVLRKFAKKFEGKLVTSQDFFLLIFEMAPELQKKVTLESLSENWLHSSGMPVDIESFKPSPYNKLFIQVYEEVDKWKKWNTSSKKRKRKKFDPQQFSFMPLTSEQRVLVLESLLEGEWMARPTLTALESALHPLRDNAEVQHRWFELVVKYRIKSKYLDLQEFLSSHLALGVYLYGEAIHSLDPKLRGVAEACFEKLRPQMEPNYRDTIQSMIQEADAS